MTFPNTFLRTTRTPLNVCEIQRLSDDVDMYGPKGTGHIVHVDIPKEVEQSYEALKRSLSKKLFEKKLIVGPEN